MIIYVTSLFVVSEIAICFDLLTRTEIRGSRVTDSNSDSIDSKKNESCSRIQARIIINCLINKSNNWWLGSSLNESIFPSHLFRLGVHLFRVLMHDWGLVWTNKAISISQHKKKQLLDKTAWIRTNTNRKWRNFEKFNKMKACEYFALFYFYFFSRGFLTNKHKKLQFICISILISLRYLQLVSIDTIQFWWHQTVKQNGFLLGS